MPDNLACEKLKRFYRFLREYAAIRFPSIRDIDKIKWKMWLSELPEHECIFVRKIIKNNQEFISEDTKAETLIRIRKPNITKPPEPPSKLKDWLKPGWEDPFIKEPEVIQEKEVTPGRKLFFNQDNELVRQWESWKTLWHKWADIERVNQKVFKIYEKFHELHSELKRESERYELVLADGILSWSWKAQFGQLSIYFPLILLPVQLDFNPLVPEFIIREHEISRNVEIYTGIIKEAPLPNPQVLSSIQEEPERENLLMHPLEETDTSNFLKRIVHRLAPNGKYLGYQQPPRYSTYPCIGRAPLLLLRERSQGYMRSIEHILEDIETVEEIPSTLLTIIGKYFDSIRTYNTADQLERVRVDDEEKLEEVFFTKPWNSEQLNIAWKINRHNGVVVQGPPGTGKTHTIANLIGHLLAQDKSVLVTAHTTKALKVLREKIAEPLRPLCVAVLDSDSESEKQLEEAVHGICNYLSKYNASDLHNRADQLIKERKELLNKISKLRIELVEAIQSEYRSIVVAGREYTPSEAGRFIAKGIGHHDWIPGPIKSGAPLPLSRNELIELYQLNAKISLNIENELRRELIDLAQLPRPEEVEKEISLINQPLNGYQQDWWEHLPDEAEIETLSELIKTAKKIGQRLLEAEPWELTLVNIGEIEEKVNLYEKFFKEADNLTRYIASVEDRITHYQPKLSKEIPIEEQEKLALDLAKVAERNGGRIGLLNKLFIRCCKPQKHKFIKSVRVNSGSPVSVEHFRALADAAAIEQRRQYLKHAWEELITRYGGPKSEFLGDEPEQKIKQYEVKLRDWLTFHHEWIIPFRKRLEKLGFKWDQAYKPTMFKMKPHEYYHDLGTFLTQQLVHAIEARILFIRQVSAQKFLDQAIKKLNLQNASPVLVELRKALEVGNTEAYQIAYNRYVELYSCLYHYRRREELLKRLEESAPEWANAIRKRIGIHGKSELPGDPEEAWIWRQLYQEILNRNMVNIEELQEKIHRYIENFFKITTELVKCKVWAYCLEKTTEEHRQALMGWLNTIRRIGKGHSKQVLRLRSKVSQLLTKAKDAVPVWIMPLSRVAEQFDPRKTRFDVVIIDEASQCDILGFIALYLGKQVIVVGDHEQVSPEGVGQELDRIIALQEEYLYDIPNYHLYDGKRSIYDIARESFGGVIMLVEHFRCVPEIIQFSNKLCYGGRIRPLRDSRGVPLKPYVIPYRVEGIYQNKCNVEEARFIAAVVVAMTEHPAYQDKSIGVISMVGEEQAKLIEKLLYPLLPAHEILKHRILCGTPPQFQGDERDVILLSLVDSSRPDGRPLPIRQDDRFKQRFNVAVSRARDQLWVIYSLDPKIDMQEGDLRRKLIEYALEVFEDPEGFQRMILEESKKTESPFEQEVLERLIRAGYHVRSQVPVGNYRIDIVVEGQDNRVAIECDGDRWHPPERIWEDLERQAVLERVGWKFIRIRGSEFYRDPENTMQKVFKELERMGVKPASIALESSSVSQKDYELSGELIRRANEI